MVLFGFLSEGSQSPKSLTIPTSILVSVLDFVANAGTGKEGDAEGIIEYKENGKTAQLIVRKGVSVATYLWSL